MSRLSITLVAPAMLVASLSAATFDVTRFGAKGDGKTKDTRPIQEAIDRAAAAGGGTVMVPTGTYLSGTIHLKSNITLHLENGATLLASPDNNDFEPYEQLSFKSVSDRETTYFRYALIAAENVDHIAITGQGVVDGNRSRRGGPKTVAIKLCRYVTIRGIIVRNSPNYAISFWGSDYVDVDGVTVLNSYADGIDPDSCRYVRISNCYVDSSDDAICPKASPSMGIDKKRPVEHLTVTNCVLRTNSNNFKFGTESSGDFRDITVSNLTISPRDNGQRPLSGISLESVDGSNIDGVAISNITMAGVQTPVFIRLGNRGRGLNPPKPGSIQNISITNVVARHSSMTSSITGLPGYPVRRVMLNGLTLSMDGGGKNLRGLEVPELADKYPEGTMFGQLPSFGLYARHVDGLVLTNVHTRWEAEDLRPNLLFDDVKELTLDGFRTDTVAGASPIVWMNNVSDAVMRGARSAPASLFLLVSGTGSSGISLLGNDFTRAARSVDVKDVPAGRVIQSGNASMPPRR